MRILGLLMMIAAMMMAVPAFAVDDVGDPGQQGYDFDDSRRPDLLDGEREVADKPDKPANAPDAPQAGAPEYMDGGSSWEEFYSQTIDWTMFLERLYEVLTNEKMRSAHPEVAHIADIYRDLGMFSMDMTDVKYAATGDSIFMMSRATYGNIPDGSYIERAMNMIDNHELQSAQYIAPDDYVMYFGITDIVDKALLELEAMEMGGQLAEDMGGENPFNEIAQEMGMESFDQVLAMLKAMQIEEMAKGMMSGELALVLYDMPPVEKIANGYIMPDDLDMALFIGLNDEAAVMEMINSFGADAGIKEIESDAHAEFRYFTMEGMDTIGMIIGQGMGIITPNMPALMEHLHKDNVGMEVEPCAHFLDINMARLHDSMLPLMDMAMGEFEGAYMPTEETAYLLNLPEPGAIGNISLLAKFEGEDGMFVGMEMKKALLQYGLYYMGVFACGAAQMEMGGNVHMDEMEEGPEAPMDMEGMEEDEMHDHH